MMMFAMLTEETPTYICFSGFVWDRPDAGRAPARKNGSAAAAVFRRGIFKARNMGHLRGTIGCASCSTARGGVKSAAPPALCAVIHPIVISPARCLDKNQYG